MQALVRGMGAWLPPRVVGNDHWPAEFVERGHLMGDRLLCDIPSADGRAGKISDRYLAIQGSDPFLGAKRRRLAEPDVKTAYAEAEAARAALKDAGIEAASVDYVFSFSTLFETVSPPSACYVAHAIGAARAVCCGTDLACASAIGQLAIAQALIVSGQARHVLLTQSHLITRALPLMHPALPGLGDAATAIVVSGDRGRPIVAIEVVTHSDYADAVSWRRPGDKPWWETGKPFSPSSFRPAAAKQLMRDTVAYGAQTLAAAAERGGVLLADVGTFASVQPRGWIPHAIAECAGIPEHAVSCTYEDYAHLGACGPIVNWLRARERGERPGHTALYAQGAGFTRAAALIGAA